jgi:hypothetical protein
MRCQRGAARLILLSCAALILAGMASSLSADTVTFKQNATTPIIGGTYLGMEDTMIISNGLDAGTQFSEADNFGARVDLNIGSAALGATISGQRAPRNTMLRYNVSALSGQYTTINSVTLRLFTKTPGGGANTAQMYRIADANSGWVEGIGTSAIIFGPEDVGGATYNFKIQGATEFTGTPWAGSDGCDLVGTDIGLSPVATTALIGTEPVGSAFDLVIGNSATATTMIGDWITGLNAGLLLKTANQAIAFQYLYYSSEELEAGAFEPELIVDYDAVPEPTMLLPMLLVGILARRRRA